MSRSTYGISLGDSYFYILLQLRARKPRKRSASNNSQADDCWCHKLNHSCAFWLHGKTVLWLVWPGQCMMSDAMWLALADTFSLASYQALLQLPLCACYQQASCTLVTNRSAFPRQQNWAPSVHTEQGWGANALRNIAAAALLASC